MWMFEPGSIQKLLKEAGFEEVRVIRRYIARPFLMGAMRLHLSPERRALTEFELRALRVAIKLDDLLVRSAPKAFFGGFAFAARRPT